jgi:hypothetical protein
MAETDLRGRRAECGVPDGLLERSAGRAQARGGLVAAAAFLERSVTLTAEPERGAERTLAGALPDPGRPGMSAEEAVRW